ncbi:MAG: hypothetical protein GY832_09060 [Chloroflexi bacterium]|nr:hypothetical protein [Chloroflexota bacterium]
MDIITRLLLDVVGSLIGIFVGTLAALAADRYNERRRNRRRAKIILRSLAQELNENYETLRTAKPTYQSKPWGKSFYISTIAWETALSSGDLPEIIGFGLADAISAQYALLVRIRYYVNLLTQLWFAPTEIQGYEDIRKGFRQVIVKTMNQAMSNYSEVMRLVGSVLKDV